MGKRKKDDEKKEKPVFGSGAEPQPEPKDDGLVRCVCTVACAWRGYHEEGDKVWIRRELLESDPFFKGHFKAVEPLSEGQRRQDGENADGGNENADGSSDNADGEDENGEGADGNDQGELDLK